jgi:hypothetical protein
MSVAYTSTPQQPQLYIHRGTQNRSFLNICAVMREIGIRNHLFPLYLFDPSLADVDPHSESLDTNTKMRILHEITRNPWYYLREIIKIRQAGGNARFEINRGTLAMLYLLFSNVDQVVILPRQTYKTFSMAAAVGWIYKFGSLNTHMAFLNKDNPGAIENLNRMKETLDSLPSWLKYTTKKDINNAESVYNAHQNNRIQIYGPATNEAAADNKGRGLSYAWLWIDEGEWIKYIETAYGAMAPAHGRARAQAIKNGSPYGKHITTTPNYIDDDSAAFIEGKIINQSVRFIESMYDMPLQLLRNYIAEHSTNDFVHVEYTWQELGFTREWYESECRQLNNDVKKIAREIDLKRRVSNDTSPYDEALLVRAEMECLPPYRDIYVNNRWILKLIRRYIPNRPVFISIDPASGRGGDNTAVVVFDLLDMSPIGYFESNKIQPHQLVDFIETLISEVFCNCLFTIENNFDEMLVTQFAKGKHGDKLCWEYRVKHVRVREDNSRTGDNKSTTTNVREYGFTTGANRTKMFDVTLEMCLRLHPRSFLIEKLVSDIRGLVNNRGRIEARKNLTDDIVMAWLFGRHMYHNPNEYPEFARRRLQLLYQWRDTTDMSIDDANIKEVREAREAELMKDESFAKSMLRRRRLDSFSRIFTNSSTQQDSVFTNEILSVNIYGDDAADSILQNIQTLKPPPPPSGQVSANTTGMQLSDLSGVHVNKTPASDSEQQEKRKQRNRIIMDLNR